jgi:CubicO group peptidase (beta-lactamase class C family)
MMRIRSVLLSCLAFVLAAHAALAQPIPRAEPESVGLSAARLQRLTGVFQGYADEGRLAGAVALVARQGKVAYLGAFGERDRESGSPMTGDTIFRIASQTKALVSVGIMMLQEEGRLLLSDSVGKYIPELTRTTVAVLQDDGGYDVVDADRPITLRQLLTHTACISYGYGIARDRWAEAGIQGWYFADRDEPVGATVSRMAALPFECQPGERRVYGYATDILGVVIERVSGTTLDDFLQARILEPLGMHDTHFYLPAGKVDRLATVYSASEEDGLDRAPDGAGMDAQGNYVEGPRKAFSGGAGLLSTASDYARFLQMLLNGGELDGVRVLSPKTVELMTVDHLDGLEFEPGLGFGLGFRVTVDVGARGVPGSLGEYGWGGAYHSTYWVDPEEELVVVYFTQLRPSGDLDDHAKLRALVYQAIVEPGRER